MKINEKNLAAFAAIPPFDCEGWLNKRGEVNKAFQSRYFVLKGNLLFYFEQRGDKEPHGLIIVEGCTIELSEERHDYCFEIVFNGNRTYILCADSQDNMEKWMKALTCAGYEYKKLMVAELQRQLKEIEESSNKVLNVNGNNSLIIKPPPRRLNPFNRPAPPPPNNKSIDTNGKINTNSKINFVNEHFDSSVSLSNKTTSNVGLIGENTVRPQKSSKSIFYDTVPLQPQILSTTSQQQPPPRAKHSNTVLPATGAIRKARRTFEEMHEEYRKEVICDINKYHESKAEPLIDISN